MTDDPSSSPVLLVRALWGGYGARPVIKGFSLHTRPGVTGLIGSNGAGKTTALKAVTGILKPDNGEITFGGANIRGEAPNRIAARGVILVPEGGGLFPSMTVEDNLLMGAYLPRARRHRAASLRDALALFPRLAERRAVVARRLSGGEQQMLAIGRALIALPRLLILDEPSLGLSPSMIDTVGKAIKRISESGVPILLCEQNASLALRISDYVYVMEHGEIVVEGEPSVLRKNPEMARAYFGG
jgi:branched-chain amino acid transport system ATP-binding protein